MEDNVRDGTEEWCGFITLQVGGYCTLQCTNDNHAA